MSALSARSAAETDRRFFEDCYLAALRDSITECRGSWQPERELAQLRRQIDLADVLILEAGGERIGLLATQDEGDALHVQALCIAPDHQSQGLGGRAMALVIGEARRRRVAVTLGVLRSNPGALRFYERLGFDVVATTPTHHSLRLEAQSAS